MVFTAGESENIVTMGFDIFKCSDLKAHELIRSYILDNLNQRSKTIGVHFNSWEDLLVNYESNQKIHLLIANKKYRLLSKDQVESVFRTELFRDIANLLGKFNVSDEEDYGWPEVYWRIVRPNKSDDIGPLHADAWFWTLNPDWKNNSKELRRTKVWIPLQCEESLNGLHVIPRSHKHTSKYAYNKVTSNNKSKPVIQSQPEKEDLLLLSPEYGSLVIFDDNLVHGGALNNGRYPRISIEFTCLTKIKDETI